MNLKIIFIFAGVAAVAGSADAMPMFSRRYHMACSTCHDAPAYPRLNGVGYRFRRAGFRMPEQIGEEQDEEFDLAHYFSARSQTRYSLTHSRDATSGTMQDATRNTFEMREFTFFPLTGSFDRNWASQTKVTLDANGRPTLNNAYVRGVWGNDEIWFEARAGIGHPIEGYGASDRPLGASRPLFETAGSYDTQDTLVRPWGIDRLGAEVGVQWLETSVSVSVLNRLEATVANGAVGAVGITSDAHLAKDFVVFANQLIGEQSGVSAYWIHGSIDLPVDLAAFVDGTDHATWRNSYDRFAAFGAATVGPLLAQLGVAAGLDGRPSSDGGGQFASGGAFAEADVTITPAAWCFLRADYFDPSWRKRRNQRHAGTLGAAYATDWLKFVSELQLERASGAMGNRVDASLRLHATVAF